MMELAARFRNTYFVTGLFAAAAAFAYQVCGLAGIVPPISQDQAVQAFGLLVNVLVAMGVLVDPTTPGLSDGEDLDAPEEDVEYTDEETEVEGETPDTIEEA